MLERQLRQERPLRQMNMTLPAVNEHELVHGPTDRFDRALLHLAFGIHQRDVRGEIPSRQTLQAFPRQRGTKRSSKRPQAIHPIHPMRTNGRLPGLPRKLTERSNQISNGSARTSAAASHAIRMICSDGTPRKKSETCKHSGTMIERSNLCACLSAHASR